jgi:hypothetical protein
MFAGDAISTPIASAATVSCWKELQKKKIGADKCGLKMRVSKFSVCI